jgi:hypothetical protein
MGILDLLAGYSPLLIIIVGVAIPDVHSATIFVPLTCIQTFPTFQFEPPLFGSFVSPLLTGIIDTATPHVDVATVLIPLTGMQT